MYPTGKIANYGTVLKLDSSTVVLHFYRRNVLIVQKFTNGRLIVKYAKKRHHVRFINKCGQTIIKGVGKTKAAIEVPSGSYLSINNIFTEKSAPHFIVGNYYVTISENKVNWLYSKNVFWSANSPPWPSDVFAHNLSGICYVYLTTGTYYFNSADIGIRPNEPIACDLNVQIIVIKSQYRAIYAYIDGDIIFTEGDLVTNTGFRAKLHKSTKHENFMGLIYWRHNSIAKIGQYTILSTKGGIYYFSDKQYNVKLYNGRPASLTHFNEFTAELNDPDNVKRLKLSAISQYYVSPVGDIYNAELGFSNAYLIGRKVCIGNDNKVQIYKPIDNVKIHGRAGYMTAIYKIVKCIERVIELSLCEDYMLVIYLENDFKQLSDHKLLINGEEAIIIFDNGVQIITATQKYYWLNLRDMHIFIHKVTTKDGKTILEIDGPKDVIFDEEIDCPYQLIKCGYIYVCADFHGHIYSGYVRSEGKKTKPAERGGHVLDTI